MNNLIDIKNLSFSYNGLSVFDNAVFNLNTNDFAVIQGKSGQGKTTLLKLILKIEKEYDGDIFVFNKNLTTYKDAKLSYLKNKKFGVVFQNYILDENLDVIENVLLPITIYKKPDAQDIQKAKDLLTKLGIQYKDKSNIRHISGGQIQRVAIARALINEPDILLLDEPTSELDNKTAREIIDLLVFIHQNMNKTLLIVSHDDKFKEYEKCLFYRIANGKITKNNLSL